MVYIGLAIDELSRGLFALREDGAVYLIEWQRDLAAPTVKLFAKLPNEEPPDSAA